MNKKNFVAITGIGTLYSPTTSKESWYSSYLQQNQKREIVERTVHFYGKKYSHKAYKEPEVNIQILPARLRRRMSLLARIVAISALQCLKESGLEHTTIQEDLGIVVGTRWGEHTTVYQLLEQIIDQEKIMLSPTLFHNSVHNAAAGYLGMILKAKGPTLTVSHGICSFGVALETAFFLVVTHQCPAVLTGVGDTIFDFQVLEKKEHTLFSTGSCFLLFENMEYAQKREAPIIARYAFLLARSLKSKADAENFAEDLQKILESQYEIPISSVQYVMITRIQNSSLPESIRFLCNTLFSHATKIFRIVGEGHEILTPLAILKSQNIPSYYLISNHRTNQTIEHILCITMFSQQYCQVFLLTT